jgi:hypothetical protein
MSEVAIWQPSALDVLPAPRLLWRHRHNTKRLDGLRDGLPRDGWWWNASTFLHEASSQLASEGFVLLDGFCGAECGSLPEQVDELLARQAGRGRIGSASSSSADGASEGSAALTRLRGDMTVWVDHSSHDGAISFFPLVRRISALAAQLGAPGLPTASEARDIDRRSELQARVLP